MKIEIKKFKRLLLVVAMFAGAVGLSACGGSNTDANAVNAANCTTPGYTYTNGACTYTGGAQTAYGNCTAGSLYSAQYGCLPQGSCQSGSAMYNGTCMYIGNTGMTGIGGMGMGSCGMGAVQTMAGCLPQGICAQGYGFGYNMGQPWCFPATGY
jgi:hypothetical protein